MHILIDSKGTMIAYGMYVEFGEFEGEEKWGFFDSDDKDTRKAYFYVIDHNYTLVENVELPEDYEDGKYFFIDGEFTLNEEWKPFKSAEERIAELERQLANLNGDAVWDEMAVAIEEGVNQV